MGRFTKTTGALLLANVAMFAVFTIVALINGNGDSVAHLFGLNSSSWLRPWTFVTYMFTDNMPINLLFNCLWLWLFARMLLEAGTDRQLLISYFAGGFGGALFFLAGTWITPMNNNTLLGASASILGVVSYAAVRVPYMRLNLMFFGSVKYMWIGIVAVGLSLLSFATGNIGTGLAHIGGAVGGACYALILRSRRGKYRLIRPTEQNNLDGLLDKVHRSGYGSLTDAERRQLDEYSRKL